MGTLRVAMRLVVLAAALVSIVWASVGPGAVVPEQDTFIDENVDAHTATTATARLTASIIKEFAELQLKDGDRITPKIRPVMNKLEQKCDHCKSLIKANNQGKHARAEWESVGAICCLIGQYKDGGTFSLSKSHCDDPFPEPPCPIKSGGTHKLRVGDKVVAKYPPYRGKGDNPFFAATVDAIDKSQGTASMKYDDGDYSKGVRANEIRYAPHRDTRWGKDKLRGNNLIPKCAGPVTIEKPPCPKGFYKMQSYNYPAYSMDAISASEAKITKQGEVFEIVPAIYQAGDWAHNRGAHNYDKYKHCIVSLKSTSKSNTYLRHASYYLREHQFQDNSLYRLDASFYMIHNKWYPGTYSFLSVNYNHHYIRHSSYRLSIGSGHGDLFQKDASYKLVKAPDPAIARKEREEKDIEKDAKAKAKKATEDAKRKAKEIKDKQCRTRTWTTNTFFFGTDCCPGCSDGGNNAPGGMRGSCIRKTDLGWATSRCTCRAKPSGTTDFETSTYFFGTDCCEGCQAAQSSCIRKRDLGWATSKCTCRMYC